MNVGENIEFETFQFDKQMRYLFIVVKKVIKMYDIKTGIVQNSFDGNAGKIKEIILSDDGQHLFR
jgi:hypothetical protein